LLLLFFIRQSDPRMMLAGHFFIGSSLGFPCCFFAFFFHSQKWKDSPGIFARFKKSLLVNKDYKKHNKYYPIRFCAPRIKLCCFFTRRDGVVEEAGILFSQCFAPGKIVICDLHKKKILVIDTPSNL